MARHDRRLEIRRVIPADLDDLARLEASSFPDPWSRGSLAESLAKPGGHLWLGHLGEETVAYACFLTVLDESELLRLAVHPRWRRSGLGRRLLCHGLTCLEASGSIVLCHLEVRADNSPARHLYESLGFTVSGRRPDYYRQAAAPTTHRPAPASTGKISDAVDAVLYQRPMQGDGRA